MSAHHAMPPSTCPACTTRQNMATGIAVDRKPTPGDYTVCYACAALLHFNDQLQLARLPAQELIDMDPEQRQLLLSAAAQVMLRKVRR